MLNQTSEHAVRAMLYLAGRPAGEAVPAERIAAALGAPANYLSKTLGLLAKRGLVTSSRGAAGGFRLARPAGRITLAEIVAPFMESSRGAPVCLLGDRPCDAQHPCAAHAQWSCIQERMLAPLRGSTLVDLLAPAPGARAGTVPLAPGRP